MTDIMLQQGDLPYDHVSYFTIMDVPTFKNEFGEIGTFHGIPDGSNLRRIIITLPLQIEDNNVIPIPFIVDTGAPSMLVLGLAARDKLREMKVLKELHDSKTAIVSYNLNGRLLAKGGCYIDDPTVDDLPSAWASNEIWKDERANLLGLKALCVMNATLSMPEILATELNVDELAN